MAKIKCRVCGFEWTPTKEDHYVARQEQRHTSLFANGDSETVLYDAWDCPVCGAQFAAEGRKRRLEEPNDGFRGVTITVGNPYKELDDRVSEDCEGCKYAEIDGDEYPCSECARNHEDFYAGGSNNGDK